MTCQDQHLARSALDGTDRTGTPITWINQAQRAEHCMGSLPVPMTDGAAFD